MSQPGNQVHSGGSETLELKRFERLEIQDQDASRPGSSCAQRLLSAGGIYHLLQLSIGTMDINSLITTSLSALP